MNNLCTHANADDLVKRTRKYYLIDCTDYTYFTMKNNKFNSMRPFSYIYFSYITNLNCHLIPYQTIYKRIFYSNMHIHRLYIHHHNSYIILYTSRCYYYNSFFYICTHSSHLYVIVHLYIRVYFYGETSYI